MVMHVELQATCSALGYLEGKNYVKEPDCLETVKDLLRFLKREDETCDIRRQLGHAQIVQNDLIPLLITYPDDVTLYDTVIRLLVNLTQPARLCFRNEVPEDKTMRVQYMEIESHLGLYKEAFANEALFAVLTKKLGDLLQLEWDNREEEDKILLERLLVLVRNVLHVAPNLSSEKRTDDDASVHDQVLWAMHVSGMEDLLLFIASSDEERLYAIHTLEIISLMFREQTPEQLAHAGSSRSMTEKERDEQELRMAREKERAEKRANMMKYNTRHSRFGGTYVVQNFQSISNRELIYHRSLGDSENISFDHDKRPKKKPKNRKPITEKEFTRRSTLSIRLLLKDFCVQFLDNCYNPLMYAVKDNLMHEKTQDNDETYYLWAIRFFMEFSRLHNFRVDVISETLSIPTFHYIQTNLTTYHDMILSDKKMALTWSKRMHLALRAYQELLLTLNEMDRNSDQQLRDSAKVIKSNIFYLMEYRDVFLMLIKKFDQTKQSRTFLKNLIETTHLFMKMLDHYCKTTSHVIVQKKKAKKQKKKINQPANAENAESASSMFSEQELESMWDDVSEDLSDIFQGRGDVPEGVSPFDAASEVDMEQQRVNAMLSIHEALRNQNAGQAVALFRAAREVWPEGSVFGTADISPEEEFMALREVFFTNLPSNNNNTNPTQNEGGIEEEEGGPDDEVEQEELSSVSYSEQEFEVHDFIKRFASPLIIAPYALLLADYRKNSTYTNHCIIKMLHRIAVDLKMPVMLAQASIFRIFQRILFDPVTKSSAFKELVQFSMYVVRKFFEVTKDNPKAFMEVLFWKNVKECIELSEGYGSYKEHVKKTKQQWSEELDMELTRLFEEFKNDEEDPEKDVVDKILDHLSDKNKTRRQVVRQLVNLNLASNAAELTKKKTSSRPSRAWREEEELELRQLFDQYRGSNDPLGDITSRLTTPRSKQVVSKKLLELGLIQDKKEVHKKRGSGKGRKRSVWEKYEDEPLLPSASESEDEGTATETPIDDVLDNMEESSASDMETSSDKEGSEKDTGDGSSAKADSLGGSVKQALKAAIDTGCESAVKWLQTGLRRTAEDREEEDTCEPVPLVPLTEDNEDAMEKNEFQHLLKLIGISPPSNEQERFWRIPVDLDPLNLVRLANVLDPNSEDDVVVPSKDNSRRNKLKDLAKQKRKLKKNEEKTARAKNRARAKPKSKPSVTSRLKRLVDDSSDSDDEKLIIDEGLSALNNSSASKHPRPNVESSESEGEASLVNGKSAVVNGHVSSESDDEPLVKNSETKRKRESSESEGELLLNSTSKLTPMRKKSRVLVNDEESDTEETQRSTTNQADSDSDEEPLSKPKETFPATMFSQTMEDSDSDIEDHIPIRRAVKRQQIDSDSD